MQSEEPHTKPENAIPRFSWYRIEGKNEEYSDKNGNVSKAQFYTEVWRSKDQSCKKLVSRKKR